jgi:hypothetical protein
MPHIKRHSRSHASHQAAQPKPCLTSGGRSLLDQKMIAETKIVDFATQKKT